MGSLGRIRVGIGGWSYEPWRETFYPTGVKASQELAYASRQVTAIEINSTFYRLQKPAIFAKWRDATPDDFVFTIKAPRFIVQRKVLAEGLDGVRRFVKSGIDELKEKLGPLLWQLDPTHPFEPDDLRAFLGGLPKIIGKLPLRHALNVRHASFKDKTFIALVREYEVAVVYEDDDSHPAVADITTDFVYARLRRSVSSQPTGYSTVAIGKWGERITRWASGMQPEDLALVDRTVVKKTARDVFVFFINGAKERAPAAAKELLTQLA